MSGERGGESNEIETVWGSEGGEGKYWGSQVCLCVCIAVV